MKSSELQRELKTVIEAKERILDSLKDSDNPQTRLMYLYHDHQIDALKAVLSRLEGNRIALNLI